MKSSIPKVLHPVAGATLLAHVMNAALEAKSDTISVVVGRGGEAVEKTAAKLHPGTKFHLQSERLGTAHAVLAAREALEARPDDVLVLFGDTPLLRADTIGNMRKAIAEGAAVACLGFHSPNPEGYGRFIENGGRLERIVEHREASDEERKIGFCNGGLMALAGEHALALLDAVSNDNSRGEYYLTDVVEIANAKGLKVVALSADETELMGINNRLELARAEQLWQESRRRELMLAGVTMTAPETVYFSHDTMVEADAVIEPHVVFAPGVTVAAGATIRAHSHLEGAKVGPDCVVGPYARLRPGTVLEAGAKIGNFVETKQAQIGPGAKVNHLTYVGDAEIGAAANIGAGTITCNYDGMNKHLTRIGEGVFIGSNSALVAPVTIGNGAYVASGSVITEDIPDDAMGVARARQTNKENHARTIRERTAAEKERRKKS